MAIDYAVPSTDGGTEPDPACAFGGSAGDPGVPFIDTVTLQEGTKLKFHYRRLRSGNEASDGIECPIDHVTLGEGEGSPVLVRYDYVPGGTSEGPLVRAEYPLKNSEETYSRDGGFFVHKDGELKVQHTYGIPDGGYYATKVNRVVGGGEDVTLSYATSALSCPTCWGDGRKYERVSSSSIAGRGDGTPGAVAMQTHRMIARTPNTLFFQHQLYSSEDTCSGSGCESVSPGMMVYEWTPKQGDDWPALEKGVKDKRGAWTAFDYRPPDAWMPEEIDHITEKVATYRGAVDMDGGQALEVERYGYFYAV